MGTKISAFTETGSAPADSYLALAYDGANYKIEAPSILAGGGVGTLVTGYAELAVAEANRRIVVADLGNKDILTVGAAVEFRTSPPFYYTSTINGTISRSTWGPHGGFGSGYFAGSYQFYTDYFGTSDEWAGGILNGGGTVAWVDAFVAISLELDGNYLYQKISTSHSGQVWSSYLSHGT